jgi:carboxymethylenebutenolidase
LATEVTSLPRVPALRLDVATPDGVADSFLALPDGEPRAGVLFLVDAYGLRERTEEMALRIAGEGYAVLVPNVFYRAGRAPVLAMPDFKDAASRERFMARVKPLMAEMTPAALAGDGAAYLEALAEHASGRAGVTGYCMGGRLGWRIAAAHPDRVASLGCFHTGGLVADAADSPHRSAAELRCELYFGFADQDKSMTAEQIAVLERALAKAGASFRAEIYASAQHGYTMADTAAFDEAACERHFRELFALLDRALPA